LVKSLDSNVTLRAGDNLTLESTSVVEALEGVITICGDFGDADPGTGTTIELLGTVHSPKHVTQVLGGADNDWIVVSPRSGGASGDTMTALRLDGKDGNDVYRIQTGGLNGSNDGVQTDSLGARVTVLIADTGSVGGDNDRAELYGASNGQEIRVRNLVAPTQTQTGGFVDQRVGDDPFDNRVAYTAGLEYLTVNGGFFQTGGGLDPNDLNDLFRVQPSQTAEITIHGSNPQFGDAGVPPGDTLDFDSYHNTVTLICGTILTNDDEGTNGLGNFQPVHYRNIENMPLDPLGTSEWRFDLNRSPAATQDDYTGVQPTTLYDPLGMAGTRFGWNAVMNGFDRGAGPFSSSFTDLLRDGHWHNASRTFTADVANGWYLVSIKTGDKSFARDQLRVTHGDTGQLLIDGLASPAGQIVDRAFLMQVTDGTLDLTFANLGGDPYWVVNGIEIRPGRILTFGSPETDVPLVADGVTFTTFTGYKATANALITVDPQLDTRGDSLPEGTLTILTPDADPDMAGHQVLADVNGVFTYTVVHPSAAGTLRVMYTEVTGAQASCFSVDFVASSIRRFDFNSGASPIQTPVAASPPGQPLGYVGVLPTQLTSPAVGYGWITAAKGFDRGALASSDYSKLLRDGAWESGPRDFRMQLPAGQVYDVTVTFGDASFARDRLNVSVVTGSGTGVTGVATAAGQFVHRSFTAAPTSKGDLVLRFSDGGGDPYWTVNAVEVRPVYDEFVVSGPVVRCRRMARRWICSRWLKGSTGRVLGTR
jgi:hypothetical protein